MEGLEEKGWRRLQLERPLSYRSVPAGRRRKPATRVLSAASALALLGGALTGCTASSSQTPPSTTTTAAQVTTSTTAPPASLQPYTWQRERSVALDLGGGATSTLSAIVAPGASGDWLIAGTQFNSGAPAVATVWTSANATRWSKTALPTPTGEGSATANAATDWGSREVVVGSAGTGPSMRAAVWVSENPGQPFLPIPDNPVFDAPTSGSNQGGAVMDTAAAGALGLFAGGTVGGRATVWYSTDGEHWQELTGADSVINRDPGAVVNDILSTPNGVFAAGSSVNGNRLSAALWYSSDGIHWSTVRSAVSTFFGNGDHVITSVLDIGGTGSQLGAPGPTGLLAVGGVRIGPSWQPASWISPNGFSWSQTSESFPLDAEPPASPGAIAYAASGADGTLYAVGGSPGRQRLWQSPDGLSWSEVRLPAAAANDTGWHLGLVAANGHTTVLADNTPGQPYVLVDQDGRWRQPSAKGIFGSPVADAVPTSLIADNNGTLVMSVELSKPGQSLGNAPSSVAVLTSVDGSSWHTKNLHAFDGVTVNQLLAVPDGLLAVGSAPLAGTQGGGAGSQVGAAGTQVGATDDETVTGAVARLSGDDGSTWPSEVIRSATPAGPMAATAAGRLGNSQYIVGQAGPDAVAWYSPDGNTWEAPQPLDSSPELGTERAIATCVTGSSAVVVGSVTSTGRGSLPVAWVSTDGSSWAPATFTPTPPAGSSTTVDGCLWTGGSFLAYGESTGGGQVERPQLWASSDGTVWQQQSAAFTGLNGGGPSGPESAPLDDIAYGTTTWLGLSGDRDAPSEVWPAPVGGAAGTRFTPAGLWTSDNAGNTWQQLGTLTPAFTGTVYAQPDAATDVHQEPGVAGTVDGQLAVWVGTPTSTTPMTGGTGTGATGVTSGDRRHERRDRRSGTGVSSDTGASGTATSAS